jgi:hypothetical protein
MGMSAFSPKQSQPPQRTPSNTTNPNAPAHSITHQQHPILNLQRTIGNQAVLRLLQARVQLGDAASETGAAASHPGFTYNFASIPVLHTPVRGMQRKLTVNTPGDAYEQEADRVAEQVMRMPASQTAAAHAASPALAGAAADIQRACACGGTCDDCRNKHPENDHAHVQMKAAGPGTMGGVEAPPIVHEVLRSSGQPLDRATREFIEPRFGHDFSHVRVHTDAKAAESARAIQAKAYTVGQNVVFGAGEFAPGTHEGQRLLGHELAHVVQQSKDLFGQQLQRDVIPFGKLTWSNFNGAPPPIDQKNPQVSDQWGAETASLVDQIPGYSPKISAEPVKPARNETPCSRPPLCLMTTVTRGSSQKWTPTSHGRDRYIRPEMQLIIATRKFLFAKTGFSKTKEAACDLRQSFRMTPLISPKKTTAENSFSQGAQKSGCRKNERDYSSMSSTISI